MPAKADSQNSDLFLTRREAMQGIVTLAASSLLSADSFSEATTPVEERSIAGQAAPSDVREFNNDWRFHRGDAPGAEASAFDDSSWRVLDVPHDWSIENLPGPSDPDRDAIWTEGTNPYAPAPSTSKPAKEGVRPAGSSAVSAGTARHFRRLQFLLPARRRFASKAST